MTNSNDMKNESYVIIEIQHLSALFQALTMKFKLFKNDDVVLIVNNLPFADLDFTKNLVKNNVFIKIICIFEPSIKFDETGKDFILKFYDNIFEQNNLDIKNAKTILTACDVQNFFSIYCILNHKKIDFIELYANQFANKNRYHINTQYLKSPIWIEELSRKYNALTGDNRHSNHRYLYPESKIEYKNIDNHFDFLKEYFSISNEDKDLIVKCLDIKDNNLYHNCNILLLNSFGYSFPKTNLGMPNHYLPFMLIADYYFKDEPVFIKDHPQTMKKSFVEYIEPYMPTINSTLPIEIFALIPGFHDKKLMSINSTGNDKLKDFIDEEIRLTDNYYYNYNLVHKLFVAFKIESLFGNSYNYHHFGINRNFLKLFKDNATNLPVDKEFLGINTRILKGNILTLIGDYSDEDARNLESALVEADKKTKVVFIKDIANLISLNNIKLLDNFIVLTIHKNKLRDKYLGGLEDEQIFIFSKDQEFKNDVLNFSFEKNLIHTGIKISINSNETKYNQTINNIKISLLFDEVTKQKQIIENLKNNISNDKN